MWYFPTIIGLFALCYTSGITPSIALAGDCTNGGLKLGLGSCSSHNSGLMGLYSGQTTAQPSFQGIQTPSIPLQPVFPNTNSKWTLKTRSDPQSGIPTYYLSLTSENKKLSAYGPDNPAKLMIRCNQNETNVLVQFPGFNLKNEAGFRHIELKLPGNKQGQLRFEQSNNHSIVGLWDHKNATAFLKLLTQNQSIQLSSDTSGGSKISADFKLNGLSQQARSISTGCNFQLASLSG